MSIELRALKQLMPTGYNWEGVESGVIAEQLEGLSKELERDSDYSDSIINNYLPFNTKFYAEQEEMFRLPTTDLTDAERLARIKGAWSNTDPSTYTGFNELLALNGFDDIIVRPLAESEDPTAILDYYKIFTNGVNGIIINDTYTALGRAILGADSGTSNLGKYVGSAEYFTSLSVPSDEAQWGMIFVIEGSDGEVAEISDELKTSFEFLIYKLKPLFMMGLSRVKATSDVLFRCDFISDVTTGQDELLATFATSIAGGTEPYTYSWSKSFNNGAYEVFSTDASPIELFDELGCYSIKLDIEDANGLTTTITKEDYICIVEFEADFSASATSGDLPLEVDFTNTTMCDEVDSYLWELSSDGESWITAGTQKDLNYIFNFKGLYWVRLTVTKDLYTASETKENYIKAGGAVIVEQHNFSITNADQAEDFSVTLSNPFLNENLVVEIKSSTGKLVEADGIDITETSIVISFIEYLPEGTFTVTIIGGDLS